MPRRVTTAQKRIGTGAEGRGPSTADVVLALARPVARTLPWLPVVAGAGVGLLLAAVPRLSSEEPDEWLTLLFLRVAALAFGLGLAFLVDDPARHTTAAVPVRRAVRAGLRVAMVAPVAVGWWAAVLLLVPEGVRLPLGDVTLEAAAVAALALAGGAVAVRCRDEPEPGRSTAAGLLITGLVGPFLIPDAWTPFTQLDTDPRWDDAHEQWACLLTAAALAWTLGLPEPLHRRRLAVALNRR